MAFRRRRHRRFLLPLILAATLAAEITGLTIARSIGPAAPALTDPRSAAAPSRLTAGRLQDDVLRPAPSRRDAVDLARDPGATVAAVARTGTTATRPSGPPASGHSTARGRGAAPTTQPSFHGRNHVWIPALDVSRAVSGFSCSRTRAPDNATYRWGCAGSNNVYLMGHAWGVFKPLHDAYVGGRLRKGMRAVYADAGGRVHTYSVAWWRLVRPTTSASWAWAAQNRPSMTLQTCVGSNSQYRLIVRLVEVG